jgi:hypothetical protein
MGQPEIGQPEMGQPEMGQPEMGQPFSGSSFAAYVRTWSPDWVACFYDQHAPYPTGIVQQLGPSGLKRRGRAEAYHQVCRATQGV